MQDCQAQHEGSTIEQSEETMTTAAVNANFLISMENFDDKISNAREALSLACCHQNQSLTNVTCGQGLGCAGICSARSAVLCPSRNCTEDPNDCQLSSSGLSLLSQSSDQLSYCVPSCRVLFQPECCLHPTCLEAKPRNCKWTQYFSGREFYIFYNIKSCSSGNSCPKPAALPHGNWILERVDMR